MIAGSIPSLGSARAPERVAARPREPQVAMVETVRPLDRQTRLRADTDILRSEPATERRRLDIRV